MGNTRSQLPRSQADGLISRFQARSYEAPLPASAREGPSTVGIMLLTGILLMAVIGLIAVESVGYRRGGFDSEFWKKSLDEKLDHVATHTRDWWLVSIAELVGIFLMTAGLAALTYLLATEGEGTLAFASFGGYLVALMAWVSALIAQTTTLPRAATDRAETGKTPAWIQPFWDAGYLAEGVWIVGTNLAYAVMGVAILRSGLLPAWSGWAALVLGLFLPVVVLITKAGFPQLGGLVPFIIGIAAIIESV